MTLVTLEYEAKPERRQVHVVIMIAGFRILDKLVNVISVNHTNYDEPNRASVIRGSLPLIASD